MRIRPDGALVANPGIVDHAPRLDLRALTDRRIGNPAIPVDYCPLPDPRGTAQADAGPDVGVPSDFNPLLEIGSCRVLEGHPPFHPSGDQLGVAGPFELRKFSPTVRSEQS